MLLVKVLCDQCGQKIGEMHEDPLNGDIFYQFPHGHTGGVATSPDMVYCLTHGWAHDLESADVLGKALTARKTRHVATHRARCTPRFREPLD